MINWFDMPAEGLSNGGEFEIKELTATENKVYEKAGEVYNKVTVNVEGGGGGGDFSTAEVTFIVTEGGVRTHFAYIDPEYNDIEILTPSLDVGEVTYTLPLYKNGQYINIAIAEGTTPTISGDISYDGHGFAITGNGTISVEGDIS